MGKLQTTIRLKKNWRAIASNRLPMNVFEYYRKSKLFKKGTEFMFYGRGDTEKYATNGWMYRVKPHHIDYAHFYSYVLDHWREYPDMFEEVAEKVAQ